MSGMEKREKLKIPFAKIKEATKDFLKEIGKGGYGSVYEGKLSINGEDMKVAVKRLNKKGQQGSMEFLNERDLLSGKQHNNIITLVGYCDEENEKIIVYEFAERGSLDFYFGFTNANYVLTWLQRVKIVVDVARGLDHIHNHLQKDQVIIHMDIKTSNILLDNQWVAKISDFGLSKSTFSFSGLDSNVDTLPCGTFGYVEPELEQFSMANPKTDVYSFGMLLFEVLFGRLCNINYGDDIILSAKVAQEYYTEDKLDSLIDPIIKQQMNPEALSRFATIAYKCLQRRDQRPLMDVVKKELEEILRIQVLHSTPTHNMPGMEEWNPLKKSFQEIKDATNDFKMLIGEGGFGNTYKGELSVHGKRMKVVVKRSHEEFGQGVKEFLTEIQFLSVLPHENLLTLLGFCDEGKEKIIVYEYAEHGSLDMYVRHNNGKYTLSWLQRLKIVVDAARGLDHLHNHIPENYAIIHRDIKSSKIMIYDKWVAKISDFGLSKSLVTTLDSFIVTNACGTYGYVEPEYISTSTVTRKADVYSFGVVLFEVLCGRLAYYGDENNSMLSMVAKEYYDNDQLDTIIDPFLREQVSPNSLRKFSAIAYNCLQAREKRPLIEVVKRELEETLQIEVLHWRSFFSRHWYILNVEDLSPETNIVMQEEETKRLKSLSVSCENDITNDKTAGSSEKRGGGGLMRHVAAESAHLASRFIRCRKKKPKDKKSLRIMREGYNK